MRKVFERVLKRIRELVNVDGMQLGFMPGRGTTDALSIVRRIQKERRDKESCMRVLWILKRPFLIEFQEK